MANLFGNLDTPKWMGPGDDWLRSIQASESIGRNVGGAVRNVLGLIGMQQDKEQFDSKIELQKRQLQLDALKTVADLSQTATAQQGSQYALSRKIEADQGMDSWLGAMDGNLQSILDAQLPTGAAAVPALAVQEKAAQLAAHTAIGQMKVGFIKDFNNLDPSGKAAVRQYWDDVTAEPSWMAMQEMDVQTVRVQAEDQARKLELFGAQNTARAKTASDLEDQKQRGRIALAEKRVGGGLDPKTKMAFSARMKVAMEEGDFGKADRIIAEFEGGAPHEEEGFAAAAKRKDAESQLGLLAKEKLKHQQELAKTPPDKHDDLSTWFKNRETRIKEIDKEMAILQEIISGKASAPGAPAASSSAPPTFKWNSNTKSFTR